jgi:hypothetical protein
VCKIEELVSASRFENLSLREAQPRGNLLFAAGKKTPILAAFEMTRATAFAF